MIPFMIAAAVITLLGLAFFLPLLRGRLHSGRPSRAGVNLLLHEQRRQELVREASDSPALLGLTAESERNLLGDLEAAAEPPPRDPTAGRTALAVALALMPFCALLAYLGLGRPDLIGQPPPAERQAEMNEVIQKLAERLKQNPNDVEGWVLVGRTLLTMEQPQRAAQAFDFARKLAPDSLDIKAFAAEAQAQAAGGSMAGQPAALAEEIVAKNPDHPQGLWLAGLAAAERQDMARAVSLWEKLQSQLSPDSPEAAEIARFIAEARNAGAQSAAPAPAAAPGKRIRVKVTLAKPLQSRTAPEDTLFIFARAAEGPPMPLAVVRKQVKDLPLEVELDDSMGMMQGMNLSAFPRLVVGARISKSGKPTASPGDLQGLTAPLEAQDGSAYAVEVDKLVETQ